MIPSVGFPFCHLTLTSAKPYSSPYPRELVTWGDHLRARRLERGLLQKDLAKLWHLDPATVNYWERNRFDPAPRHLPRIVDFLGYVPYNPCWTPAERVRAQREALGFSRQRFAEALGVTPKTRFGGGNGDGGSRARGSGSA